MKLGSHLFLNCCDIRLSVEDGCNLALSVTNQVSSFVDTKYFDMLTSSNCPHKCLKIPFYCAVNLLERRGLIPLCCGYLQHCVLLPRKLFFLPNKDNLSNMSVFDQDFWCSGCGLLLEALYFFSDIRLQTHQVPITIAVRGKVRVTQSHHKLEVEMPSEFALEEKMPALSMLQTTVLLVYQSAQCGRFNLQK